MSTEPTRGFTIGAVHKGGGVAGTTGPPVPPVFRASTFAVDNPESFHYPCSGNPNVRVLEQSAAALEGTPFATCFASGMSAAILVAPSLRSGDLVLAEEDLCGSNRLFGHVFAPLRMLTGYLDLSRPAHWDEILKQRPALL